MAYPRTGHNGNPCFYTITDCRWIVPELSKRVSFRSNPILLLSFGSVIRHDTGDGQIVFKGRRKGRRKNLSSYIFRIKSLYPIRQFRICMYECVGRRTFKLESSRGRAFSTTRCPAEAGRVSVLAQFIFKQFSYTNKLSEYK